MGQVRSKTPKLSYLLILPRSLLGYPAQVSCLGILPGYPATFPAASNTQMTYFCRKQKKGHIRMSQVRNKTPGQANSQVAVNNLN